MKFLIKCIKIPAYVLTGILVVFVTGFLILHFGLKLSPYVVLSGSMEPAVPTGGIAFCDNNTADIKTGDIITFYIKDQGEKASIVTHRVVGIENGHFITKGDANDVKDAKPVPQSQVIGHYRFTIPELGYIYSGVSRKQMLLIICCAPALLILASILEWGYIDEN